MPKLYKVDNDFTTSYFFYCPGCKSAHPFQIKGKRGPTWTFDGNEQQPTFDPSLREFWTDPTTKQEKTTCHLFLHGGRIQFLTDSPHELKGQTVDMVEFPADYVVNGGVPVS